MKSSKITIIFYLALMFSYLLVSCSEEEGMKMEEPPQMSVHVPAKGNSWFLDNVGTSQMKSSDFDGFSWTSKSSVLRTYFRLEKAGEVHIGIKATVATGTSTIKATFQNESKDIEIKDTNHGIVYIGAFTVPTAGYYYIDLQGIDRGNTQFASIEYIALGGEATSSGVHFSNEEYFYWGRRGPSVHLAYQKAEGTADVQWFYNEVTVPEGNDVVGSYFMANGFGEGYFGMQVNSSSERRILFSVWSPYQTDDPGSIPEDQRVKLIAKGNQTTINDFGGEGSGGQSYLVFNWEAGNTYRFLLKGEPAGDNKTDYTAYFFDPKQSKWHFIAQWRRPMISTYLTGLHSFLENFDTATGPMGRMVNYNNQWVYDTNSTWHEMTRARFTADATARDKARLDYAGGYKSGENGFYLRNCGFFNETSTVDTYHTRPALGIAPDIDFDALSSN
ncbi:DUF3472 domain-containing protein [Maribellus sp. CM-23]|uniref:DUF3472 domain-containing protein n=1 Tax=Maribellus sp. CM-23 TaxID=2781026 RepID=UPI001F4041B6|nr:DUF3472 domain-containing protein [Maribellus sp. CM-23]MCE4565856.1 DUF3472 domain-containing protein [Maribellus sp. CM-23]